MPLPLGSDVEYVGQGVTGGTVLGFIFAYALVRCNMPFARWIHIFSLLPTISPPFAIAIAGGTALATLLSFYFVPVAFVLFNRRRPDPVQESCNAQDQLSG